MQNQLQAEIINEDVSERELSTRSTDSIGDEPLDNQCQCPLPDGSFSGICIRFADGSILDLESYDIVYA